MQVSDPGRARIGVEEPPRAASCSTKENTMHKLAWMCGIGMVGACAAAPGGSADPATGIAISDSFAYQPMSFARIGDTGAVWTSFSPVTVSHSTGTGAYVVTFTGLAAGSLTDATGGDVQLTAEGTSSVRCRVLNWSGSPDLSVTVQCNQTSGAPADSGFAVLFYRDTMPAQNSFPSGAAYSWVTATGGVSVFYDYNASGTHNTVTKTTGSYALTIPGATGVNASMMVTPYGGSAAGATCSIVNWGAASSPSRVVASVECRNTANQLVDSAFSFSYATTGPTLDQQGAHAWFNGSVASSSYSAALGKVEGCSPASVTATPGTPVTVTVSGDLGSWDASPFLRASLASKYGAAGYCKIESLTASGVAPSSTATTQVRCYDATGAALPSPLFTFTHVTSDASGPC
jgi:hypothetical protein